jgi:hypothetical protein
VSEAVLATVLLNVGRKPRTASRPRCKLHEQRFAAKTWPQGSINGLADSHDSCARTEADKARAGGETGWISPNSNLREGMPLKIKARVDGLEERGCSGGRIASAPRTRAETLDICS